MASFSKGTSFTDGVTGDVTAAKLHALVDAATPVGGFVTDRTAKTSVIGTDVVLISDSADSNNLKKVSITNLANNLPTAVITNGTVTTLNSTTGTITTGVIPTLTSTTKITSGTGTAAAPAIGPTGDTNTGIFFPAADTIAFSEGGAEAVRIDSSGRVGIGTDTTTDGGVTITKSVTREGDWDAKLALQSTGANDYPALFFSGCSATNRYGSIHQTASTSGNNYNQVTASIEFLNESSTAGSIRFFTNGNFGTTNPTERLRIDSSGNVGIGTTSPASKLHIKGASGTESEIRITSTTANTGGKITFYENALASHEIGSGGANAFLYIKDLYNNAERLRITSGGNVGIGTTSPATRLHVDGTIRYTNRPAAGTITAIGFDTNGDLKASSSSLRYKHNVEPYAKGLAEVAQLEPVTFNYNGEELVNAGLIVEDLDAKGFEEFVLRDSEGTADAIPYGNMVALLINAIKELKIRVEALEAA